jgi:ABC-type nitrate/sulfonate/bicarbonate transport system substrate-binding protein
MPVCPAKGLGYYRQNSLPVIITDFESGKQATDAMLSGQADIYQRQRHASLWPEKIGE